MKRDILFNIIRYKFFVYTEIAYGTNKPILSHFVVTNKRLDAIVFICDLLRIIAAVSTRSIINLLFKCTYNMYNTCSNMCIFKL